MFKYEDVKEFVNNIINSCDDYEVIKSNLIQYNKYLELTMAADTETITWLNIIIDNFELIIKFKKTFGYFNVTQLRYNEKSKTSNNVVKKREKTYEQKHYSYYGSSDFPSVAESSACGGSYRTRSGC